MKTYRIVQPVTGVDLGIVKAETPEEAIRELNRLAGYANGESPEECDDRLDVYEVEEILR